MKTEEPTQLAEFKKIADDFGFGLESESPGPPQYHIKYQRGGDNGITLEFLYTVGHSNVWEARASGKGRPPFRYFNPMSDLKAWLEAHIPESMRHPPNKKP